MTEAERLKKEAEIEAYRLKKEAELEEYKIKQENKKVAEGPDAEEQRYKNAVKAYVKFLNGLEKIRKELNIAIENSEQFEYFCKYDKGLFEGFNTKDIAFMTIKMKNLIIKLINDNYLESWTRAIEMAYEGTAEIETRINNMKTFIKMDPVLTYDAMSVSTEFIEQLEKTSKNEKDYKDTLDGIELFCSKISSGNEAINLLDTVIYSKYDGVDEAIANGIIQNPKTKSADNVKIYFRTVEEKRKKVFNNQPKELENE